MGAGILSSLLHSLEQCLDYLSDVGLNKSLLDELPLNTIILGGWAVWAMMI